jgi:hypothetical protein
MQFILTCIAWSVLMGWLFVLIAMQTWRWEPLAFAGALLAVSACIGHLPSLSRD